MALHWSSSNGRMGHTFQDYIFQFQAFASCKSAYAGQSQPIVCSVLSSDPWCLATGSRLGACRKIGQVLAAVLPHGNALVTMAVRLDPGGRIVLDEPGLANRGAIASSIVFVTSSGGAVPSTVTIRALW